MAELTQLGAGATPPPSAPEPSEKDHSRYSESDRQDPSCVRARRRLWRFASRRVGRWVFGPKLPVQVFQLNLARTTMFFQFDDVRVFVDPKSMVFLSGMTLDWKDSLIQSGFVFENPHATKNCGCGTSFLCVGYAPGLTASSALSDYVGRVLSVLYVIPVQEFFRFVWPRTQTHY